MFSASLTFFLITWRRHLLSKNSQSSVRGDEVGKCTVRSACFLVPHAGSIQPKIPEISVQNSIQPGKFSQKKKQKQKPRPPSEVDHFSRSDRSEILVELIAPLVSAYEIEMISL